MLETARRLAVSLTLGAFLALGCGGEKTEPTPSGAPTETPDSPQEAAARAAALEETWSTTLPENFPPDVPRYPGSGVAKARVVEEGGFSVAFTSDDPPEKVAAYYSDSFAAQGWSTQRIDSPDGVLLFADKGKRSASLGVNQIEGKTQIDMLLIETP